MKIIYLLIPILTGCAVGHVSPNVYAQPGRGTTIEKFTADDNHCRSISRTSIINGNRSIDAIFLQCMYSKGHIVPGRPVAQPPQARNR